MSQHFASETTIPAGNPMNISQRLSLLSLLIQLVVVGFLLDYFLFEGLQISFLARAFLIAVILIAFVRSNAAILLLLIQASLFIREPSRPFLVHGISSFLYCFAALTLVLYACSYRTLGAKVNRLLSGVFLTIADREGGAARAEDGDLFERRTRAALGLIFIPILALLAGMFAFTCLPISESVKMDWYQKTLSIGGYVWPGPTVLTLVIAMLILLGESAWRVITPAQARLYTRSTFFQYHYPDLRMIFVRVRKQRRKRVPPVIDPTPIEEPK